MREPKAHVFVVWAGVMLAIAIGRRISWALGCAAVVPYLWAFESMIFPIDSLLALTAALLSCLFVAEATENDVKRGLEVLEITGLLCAAYAMLWQYVGRDHFLTMIPGNDFRRVSVFFGQHTLYGPFCVAAAAPALFGGRFFRALLIASPVLAIDASFTYLAAGVVFAVWLIFRHGKWALLSLALSALIGGAIIGPKLISQDRVKIEPLNDNGRFALWHLTWLIARVHPIKGHGLGAFQQQFHIFQSADLRKANGIDDSKLSPDARAVIKEADDLRARSGYFFSAHSEPLESFYDFGIAGPLACVALLTAFWLAFWRSKKAPEQWALLAIVACFFANSLGNFIFHLIPQALIPLWAFVAMTRAPQESILRA